MNNGASSHKPRRQFASYCPQCGWGFTAVQNARANFCPRCGCSRPARPEYRAHARRENPAAPEANQSRIWRQSGNPSTGRGTRPAAKAPHPLIGKVTRIVPDAPPGQALMSVARAHPIAVGAGAAFVGAGLICAAPAMAVAGAAVAATGAGISTFGAVTGCLVGLGSCLAGSPQGLIAGAGIAGAGIVLGGTVAFAGGLVLASGGAMAVAGTALAYGGGTLALGAGARQLHLWEKKNGHLGRGARQLAATLRLRHAP